MVSVILGRYHTASRNGFGFIAPGQMRGATFNASSAHLWAYQFGLWGGKYTEESSSNVTARMALYDTASLNPDDRLGYSAAFTVSTPMLDSVSGASHTANVAVVDVDAPAGASFSAIPLHSGYNYHIAVLGTVGSLAHGMEAAASISMENEKFYNRTGLSQPPPLDFGSYTSTNEGHPVFWVAADINVAPSVPTFRTPLGSIEEVVPTFTAQFNDANEARGDYLNQYRIQVRRKSDGLSFWSATFTATSAERAAGEMERAYGGTTLVRGTAYEWQVQMSDHFGAWSDYSSWLEFTPSALGLITLDGAPTGKVEDNTPDFAGKWTHQTGLAMQKVQARIWNASGTTLIGQSNQYDIADVASSTAPGTAFTFPYANTGLSALTWGTGYQYQLRGYDGTQWGGWSSKRTFSTNAAPTIPSGLSPSNGIASSSYPLLTSSFSDSDDTTSTGLTGYARIKDAAGTVLFTRTMTYNATTGWWEYQTTGTDLAAYGSYRWDAYSYDGTLYSGEKTSAATATKSNEATFQYLEGPIVTVLSPVDGATVATSSLQVTWDVVPNQVLYAISVADADSKPVYNTGPITSTASTHLIPSGYLRNDMPYMIVVGVQDTSGLIGNSFIIDITVDYPPTDTVLNFTADAVNIGSDLWASAIRLNWDQTNYATDVWQDYTIVRTAGSGADAERITLARITSPTQTTFTDYTPASGVEYSYAISQTIQTGLDFLPSDDVEASASVTLGGVVLVSVTNPTVLRTALRYTNERKYGRTTNESVYEPLDRDRPTTVRSRTYYRLPNFEARLFSDAVATAATRRVELESIDADGGTYCYRDNHGRKLFVTIPDLSITDHVPDWYTAEIAMREENFSEGVTV